MARKSKKGPGGKPQQFGSLADLQKLIGGDPDQVEEDRTQAKAEAARAALVPDSAEVDSGGVASRIASRPAAFGVMAEGPPCYRDEDSDELRVLQSLRVRTRFPEDVLAEVDGLSEEPDPTDFTDRVDLRDELIFTIDGKDAKDYDDAIGMVELPDGNLRLGVHIADVGHYVRTGTKLDDEALARATSIYLPDQVIPMLPEKLSNHLCSLVPRRDRLAYSVIMDFSPEGKRLSVLVYKSVINSKVRCTYQGVQELFDGLDTAEARRVSSLRGPLELLRVWTIKQQQIQAQREALRMTSVEQKFQFNEAGEVTAIVDAPHYFSQGLIEQTALAANQTIGDRFRLRGLPTIYRVHPEKDPEEVEQIVEELQKAKIKVPRHRARLTGRDIGMMIRSARSKQNAEALIGRIMGLVESAEYEVGDRENIVAHFGLATESYLHFTSPIRRYSDLIVHRWLHAIEGDDAAASEKVLKNKEMIAELKDTANQCSFQQNLAVQAERDVKDLKVCQFMDHHKNEPHEGKIVRVSRYGADVHLLELNVRVFLPSRTMDGRPTVTGDTLTIATRRGTLSFSVGSTVRVEVDDIDWEKLQVNIKLAEGRKK
jgi:ribonuclease R